MCTIFPPFLNTAHAHCFSLGGLIQIKDKSKAYNAKVVPNLLEKLPLTFSLDTLAVKTKKSMNAEE